MDEQNNNESFTYTYSAKEQDEINKIRRKYILKDSEPVNRTDKIERIRKLDAGVNQKANVVSLIIGVIGALIMGTGMSCVMVLGADLFIPGIIIGVAGIALVITAYPAYLYVIKREREKIAPEIIRLTDEIMK